MQAISTIPVPVKSQLSSQLGENQSKEYPLANGDELPELTEGEIMEYRIQKKYRLEREAKRVAYQKSLMQPLYPTIQSTEDFLLYCQQRTGQNITIDQENAQVINLLSHYFAGIDCQLNPMKGILLYGNIGTGKTTLMRLMQEAPHASFAIESAQEIINEYAADGVQVIEKYSRLIYNNNTASRYFGNREIGLCIDDIGTETEAANFGNRKNVVAEILSMRYAQLHGPTTHLTTNLTPAELKEAYGARIYDRLREMFNVVEFPHTAQSRRQ
ncbi:MAG: AAA family ATPase [Cytophagia bacterium]|nr:MAG: AAA family ATPase [Cytophagia bacterium]